MELFLTSRITIQVVLYSNLIFEYVTLICYNMLICYNIICWKTKSLEFGIQNKACYLIFEQSMS